MTIMIHCKMPILFARSLEIRNKDIRVQAATRQTSEIQYCTCFEGSLKQASQSLFDRFSM